MESQTYVNFIVSAIIFGIGWWCKEIWGAVKDLKEDVKQIEVDLPTTYVRRADIEIRFDRIDTVLERIFDKLDEKADK